MRSSKKVYICFDYDQDKALKDLLIGQSRNDGSPFEIADGSLHEAAPDDEWEERARRRIDKADTVIVLLGRKTHCAPGVLKEVQIARELGKRVIQLVGHKDHEYTRVRNGGVLYKWTWDNLVKILGTEKQRRHRRNIATQRQA